MKSKVSEFIALSAPGTPDHFSAILFISMVEVPGVEQQENVKDVDNAVLVKGTVNDLQNMLAHVYVQNPGLFALIQESVVAHIAKYFKPEEAQKMLNKEA